MKSTRAWRMLAAEQRERRDTTGVVRLALCSMAADPTSPLTPDERQWIIAISQGTTGLTDEERAYFQEPLLAWIAERIPRCLPMIREHFDTRY